MRSNNNISRWTGVLFRRYLRQCTLWAAALIYFFWALNRRSFVYIWD